MKRIYAILIAGITMALLLWSQQREPTPSYVPFEMLSVFPREVSTGVYAQVEQRQLETLSEQGWELVGVTPYIYRNEEHGSGSFTQKLTVTQTYPAYYFKRMKLRR
jgi:hypothetical protein